MKKFRSRDALQFRPMFCMRKNLFDSWIRVRIMKLLNWGKKIIFFIKLSTSVVISVADPGCFSPQKRRSSTSKDEIYSTVFYFSGLFGPLGFEWIRIWIHNTATLVVIRARPLCLHPRIQGLVFSLKCWIPFGNQKFQIPNWYKLIRSPFQTA